MINYECNICKYYTDNKSNYNRHIISKKHQLKSNISIEELICPCGLKFKNKKCFIQHKIKCSYLKSLNLNDNMNIDLQSINIHDNRDDKLLKIIENKDREILKIKAEAYDNIIKNNNQSKTVINNNMNINNNINNNLNINILLNENCKNALNIDDFVKQIKMTLEDLFYTKDKGLVEGVSNIFIKNLQELQPKERPIHCSDKKGKNMYIKSLDKWEKNETEDILESQFDLVSKQQINQLLEWENKHPNWRDCENMSKIYMELVYKTMSSDRNEDKKKYKKIIKKKLGESCNIKDIL